MTEALTSLTATALAAAYRDRSLSPVEVTEAVIARIDAIDPDVKAFFTRTDELALDEAKAAERRFAAGTPIGPMDGIPYTIKDLDYTAGIRTTGADPKTRDAVPTIDTAVAGRLRASGGALLGKTTAPHIGYKDSPENLIAEPTGNPWDTTRNPGGSSSGAAAAVAAGFGPLAHGSDGAGSIRIPAALCGVVGFKPTFGRVPVWPNPLLFNSTVHNGPITRTVRDAALMLDVIAGPDPRDPSSALPDPGIGYLESLARPSEAPAPRLALSIDFGYGATAAEVAASVTENATSIAADLGWALQHRDPGFPDPGEAQVTRWNTLMAAAFIERLMEDPSDFEPMFQEIIAAGAQNSAFDLLRSDLGRTAVEEGMIELFSEFDYLISPAMPLTTWPLLTYPEEVDGRALPGGGVLRRAYLLWPFNFTGHPAITIPCGLDSQGLPIGLQIVGRRNDDLGVLRVAAEFEARLGFTVEPAHRPIGR